MAKAISSSLDYFARSLFRTPDMTEALSIVLDEKNKPKVYKKRWLILLSFSLTYFFWNIAAGRQTALVAEFALFYDTTNEFNGFSEPGIDFMYIFGALTLVFFYPLSGVFVDRYGLGVMAVGSVGLCLSNWWFFLVGPNYYAALCSRILANFSASLNASSLLRLSNNWFNEAERPIAVAIGAIVATIGAGAALVYSTQFSTGPVEINLNIKSCDAAVLFEELNASADELTGLECDGELEFAIDAFCCAAPTDIDNLNLSIAVLSSFVALFAVIVVEDAPTTPPSFAGKIRQGTGIRESLGLLFKHRNYNQICLADFCATGPVNLVFATIDRIFPASVSEYSITAAIIGLVLSIPSAAYFSRRLARKREYYELTTTGYCVAAFAFTGVALLMLVEREITDFILLGLVTVSFIFSIMWTVSVYELKIEYTFSSLYALQGYVVSTDRTIINFSTVVFLGAIPPERFKGDLIDGRQFSFLVGALFVVLGAVLALTIKDKRKYLRSMFEKNEKAAFSSLMDYDQVVSKEELDQAKNRRASRASAGNEVKVEKKETDIVAKDDIE